jgi:hypothetical protein
VVRAGQPQTIGPGTFELANLIARGRSRLTVRGPCELVVTTNVIVQGGSTWTLDATEGPIRIYALGNFRLGRNASVLTTTVDPSRVSFLLAGTHDSPDDRSPSIAFSADAQLYGTVVAPGLSVELEGGFELYGSLKARWVELESGARVHFDEELACGPLDPGPSHGILGWRASAQRGPAAMPTRAGPP